MGRPRVQWTYEKIRRVMRTMEWTMVFQNVLPKPTNANKHSGNLLLSSDPAVVAAFDQLVAGLRAGKPIDATHPAAYVLAEAQRKAEQTPEGVAYRESHLSFIEKDLQNAP